MRIIAIVGFLVLFSIYSFGQPNNSVIFERFQNADTTLSHFEVIDLLFHQRNISKMNKNDGLLEQMQDLEKDGLFAEMDLLSKQTLNENPFCITALFYRTVSMFYLKKPKELQALIKQTEMVFLAIKKSGKGTVNEPYYISDINDAKAFIYLNGEIGIHIDSMSFNKEYRQLYAYISHPSGKKEIVSFDFNEKTTIREVYFDYHRDFQYYLKESLVPNSRFNYKTLLGKFLNHDISLKHNEVIALMIGFTKNENYVLYDIISLEREIMNLIADKEYNKALSMSNKLLETNPLNLIALMEQGFSLMKIQKNKKYFPSFKFRKVCEAILWSGDGSFTHPYFVLDPIDGQIIIKYIFGENIGLMGSGEDNNGYYLDMLEIETKEVRKKVLLFNINHAFQTLIFDLDSFE